MVTCNIIREFKDPLKVKRVEYSKKELESMFKVFGVQSSSGKEEKMQHYIKTVIANIKNSSYKMDKKGNIYFTKGKLEEGEFYPCLAAHMDTVHNIEVSYKVESKLLLDNEDKLTDIKVLYAKAFCKTKTNTYAWFRNGGCGDDKGGVWLALNLLKYFDKIKAVFTVEEEVGCKGAKELDLDFFKDCGYILEGDRKHAGDLITKYGFTEVGSEDFLKTVKDLGKDYGYSECVGTITDVMALYSRDVGISVLNFSVGYYDSHSEDEYTIVDELINARNYAQKLIIELGLVQYEHKKVEYKSKYNHRNNCVWGRYKEDLYDDAYDGYGYDDYGYGNAYRAETIAPTKVLALPEYKKCTCLTYDKIKGAVDPWCESCNDRVIKNPIIFTCSVCNSMCEDRFLSFNCPNCGNIKVKF